MSRTERKVRDLIEDDPSMEEAIAVVAQRTGNNGDGVEWGDVSDALSSGQWGRMIETGIVVDNDNGGFRLRDPDAVESALSDDAAATATTTITDTDTGESDADEDAESEGWSIYDKLAGIGVLLIMTGYYFQPVQNVIGGALNTVLLPLDQMMPFYVVILVLAMLTGVYSTVLMSELMNTEVMESHQERMKSIRERKEKAKERDDDEALERIRQEEMDMMGDQMGMFKEQFRPMVWITLLTIPVFLWLYFTVQPGSAGAKVHGAEFLVDGQAGMILPIVGEVTWSEGVVGPMQAWIVWYFVCSMGFTQLIRKAIGIRTTSMGG